MATIRLVKSNRRDHHRHPLGFHFKCYKLDEMQTTCSRLEARRGYEGRDLPITWIAVAVCEVQGRVSVPDVENIIPVGRGHGGREALRNLVKELQSRGLIAPDGADRIPTMPPCHEPSAEDEGKRQASWEAGLQRERLDMARWEGLGEEA